MYVHMCMCCVCMHAYVRLCMKTNSTQSTCTLPLSHLQWPALCLVVVYSTTPYAEATCIRDVSGIHVLWQAVCLKGFPVLQNNNTLSTSEIHNSFTKLTAVFILIIH